MSHTNSGDESKHVDSVAESGEIVKPGENMYTDVGGLSSNDDSAAFWRRCYDWNNSGIGTSNIQPRQNMNLVERGQLHPDYSSGQELHGHQSLQMMGRHERNTQPRANMPLPYAQQGFPAGQMSQQVTFTDARMQQSSGQQHGLQSPASGRPRLSQETILANQRYRKEKLRANRERKFRSMPTSSQATDQDVGVPGPRILQQMPFMKSPQPFHQVQYLRPQQEPIGSLLQTASSMLPPTSSHFLQNPYMMSEMQQSSGQQHGLQSPASGRPPLTQETFLANQHYCKEKLQANRERNFRSMSTSSQATDQDLGVLGPRILRQQMPFMKSPQPFHQVQYLRPQQEPIGSLLQTASSMVLPTSSQFPQNPYMMSEQNRIERREQC